MANATEKEALGLKPEASDEEVQAAIEKLKKTAESAKETAREAKAEAKEANTRADEAQANAGNSGSKSSYGRKDDEVGEGQMRTAFGVEDVEEVRIKVLSASFSEYVPSPLQPNTFVEKEHRVERGQVISVPTSEADRLRSLDALYNDAEFDTGKAGDEDAKVISEMTEGELITWHRANEPSAAQVVDAAGGNVDVARRLIAAEDAATGGDPRDEVMQGLAEVIARGNA